MGVERTTMPPQARTLFESEETFVQAGGIGHKTGKKSVRIQLESNTEYPVPHIDDMTEAEIVSIWYDRSDYDIIKQSLVPIIRNMMRESKVEDTDSETTRGLEYRTRKGALLRQHNKVQSFQAVLDEQDRQLALGIQDSAELAGVYIRSSQHCLMAARKRGKKDELFVKTEMNLSKDLQKMKRRTNVNGGFAG